MIAVRLIGGLGNQMFQYAAGRALSRRLGVGLLLDTRAFNSYWIHEYGLHRLAIAESAATELQLKRWPEWTRGGARILKHFGAKTRWYIEQGFQYDEAWESISDGTIIEGYFQSERYFIDVAELLRAEFKPVAEISKPNAHYEELIQGSESVALHVRRGDYLTNKTNLKIHGVCSLEYYEESIRYIRERLERPRFFVFSNDMEWAIENLKVGTDAVYISGNEKNPENDVNLMSQCRHHIIANSSFSWWGAWLKRSKNSYSIAPKKWFAKEINICDLLPEKWIKI